MPLYRLEAKIRLPRLAGDFSLQKFHYFVGVGVEGVLLKAAVSGEGGAAAALPSHTTGRQVGVETRQIIW